MEIEVPASSAYLTVLRTAADGLAARLDYTLDDIDDLRIVVDEACGSLLEQADPTTVLICSFALVEGAVEVTARVTCSRPVEPARDTISWTVLEALAASVAVHVGPHEVSITLMHRVDGARPA